jgi:hypothetical protein
VQYADDDAYDLVERFIAQYGQGAGATSPALEPRPELVTAPTPQNGKAAALAVALTED